MLEAIALIGPITLLSLLPALTAESATEPLMADLLFGKLSHHIPIHEQIDIVHQLGFAMAEDGKTLVDSVCGHPLSFTTSIEDLNHDGTHEIFVIAGNTCLSGSTGSSIWLFIKDQAGQLHQHLGFPAAAYDVLESTQTEFPDLRFAGPGFCYGIWHWNGSTYEHLRNEPEQPGWCDFYNQ